MALWPFGREPEDVERVSRIITALTRDNVRVRAKLTLHFADPQTESAAEDAASRCEHIVELLFNEASGSDQLVGNEPAIVTALIRRLPPDLPPARNIEIAAIHVVGDPGSSTRRRPSSIPAPGSTDQVMRNLYPPAGPASGPASIPRSGRPPSTMPPPTSQRISEPLPNPPSSSPGSIRMPPSSVRLSRPFSSSSMRAITASLVPPSGSPPSVIAASLSPLLRDASTRLFIGCLRSHDLIVVRGVTIDESAAELLTALLPISEAPPGEFEASRATEVTRWRTALGPTILDELRVETWIISATLLQIALVHAGIVPHTVMDLVEAWCQAAFAYSASLATQVGRYSEQDVVAQAAQRIAQILRHESHEALELAITPLIAAVQEDMDLMARIAKTSLGFPS